MKPEFVFDEIHALIIDIDGTLWRGNTPMPGLDRFFRFVQQRSIKFVIVTNNSVETPTQYQQKLADFGAPIKLENVLTCSLATADYLKREFQKSTTIYLIGETGLHEIMRQAGFTIVDDASHPVEAVVVGGDTTLTYDKLKHAVLLIQRGARFVGTNPDLLIPTEEGFVPEAGVTLAAIQAATGVSPIIIGKPEAPLFEMATKKMGGAPARTAVLGDRLDTDILGGQRAGLKTILLTTGIDHEETVSQKGIYPDAIFSGLDELVDAWTQS